MYSYKQKKNRQRRRIRRTTRLENRKKNNSNKKGTELKKFLKSPPLSYKNILLISLNLL